MKKLISWGFSGMGFLMLILLSSCNSTKLVSSWNNKELTVQQSNKILVIALMGNRDRKLRENVENSMMAQLAGRGIAAGSALAEYGPKDFEGLDEKTALEKIKAKGYDGAFTIALLDKRKERQYVPGGIGFSPMYFGFWGYYRPMYTRIYEPGYYQVTNKFMLEANFFNLSKNELVYSAQTKSTDPNSPQSLAEAFTKTLLDDMLKTGLIK